MSLNYEPDDCGGQRCGLCDVCTDDTLHKAAWQAFTPSIWVRETTEPKTRPDGPPPICGTTAANWPPRLKREPRKQAVAGFVGTVAELRHFLRKRRLMGLPMDTDPSVPPGYMLVKIA